MPESDRPPGAKVPGIERFLEPGESVIWTGRPFPLGRIWPNGLFLALFAVAFFWIALPILRNALRPLAFPSGPVGEADINWGTLAVMLLTVAFGFLGLVIHPIRSLLRRLRTAYAVTDRRALFFRVAPTRLVRSYLIEPDMVIGIGRGWRLTDVNFDAELTIGPDADELLAPIGFEAITDGDNAIAAIERARRTTV